MNDFIKEKIQLGHFIVLPAHNKILMGEQEFKLEPKIMQVFCFLMQHKGQVVSREFIAETLWPNTVKGLDVVTRAIFELRKILKDDAKSPKFIETIARKGYCFIFPIDDINQSTKQSSEQTDQKNYNNKLVKTLIFVAIISAIIGFVIYQQNISNPTNEYQKILLTHAESNISMPAVSSSRQQVVFIDNTQSSESSYQLVLLDIKTQKQQVLFSTLNELRSPIWSKNESHLIFIECANNRCSVVKFNIQDASKTEIYRDSRRLLTLALSPSENLLAIGLIDNGIRNIGFWPLNESNIALSLLKTDAKYIGKPLFSADGKWLFFVSWRQGRANKLYQYNLLTEETLAVSMPFQLIFAMSNKSTEELWFSARLEGRSTIWSYNVNTQQFIKILNSTPGEFQTGITSSIDNSSVIYTSTRRDLNLSHIGLEQLPEMGDFNSAFIDMKAIYAADGQALYFISNRTGSYEIWRYIAGESEKLTSLSANIIDRPIISHTNNSLAFITNEQGSFQVNILDLLNNQNDVILEFPTKRYLLNWSNNDEDIYMSVPEDGTYNIYSFNLQTKKQQKILLNAGLIAQQSHDDKVLYFGNMKTRTLMAQKENGEVFNIYQLPKEVVGLSPHQINIIDNKLYYVFNKEHEKLLVSYDFDNKITEEHAVLPKEAYVSQIGKTDKVYVIYDHLLENKTNLVHLQHKK